MKNVRSNDLVAPNRIAEASVWLSRLHEQTPSRSRQAAFQRWIGDHPDNRRAFELVTEVWEDSHRLRQVVTMVPVAGRLRRPSALWSAAVACTIGIIAFGAAWFFRPVTIATIKGEQRSVVLEDGTRLFLNTDTRVTVKYGERNRRIILERGEALFEVARQTTRPFVVCVAGRQVEALGTSFEVRSDNGRMAVTLFEGKVGVGADASTSFQNQKIRPAVERFVTLKPGDRLTFSSSHGSAGVIDHPLLDSVIAWRRGQILFSNTPLSEAAAEMSRYNDLRLTVEDPAAASLPVSGLFRLGDLPNFANAIALTHGLRISRRGHQIVLSGTPRFSLPLTTPPITEVSRGLERHLP